MEATHITDSVLTTLTDERIVIHTHATAPACLGVSQINADPAMCRAVLFSADTLHLSVDSDNIRIGAGTFLPRCKEVIFIPERTLTTLPLLLTTVAELIVAETGHMIATRDQLNKALALGTTRKLLLQFHHGTVSRVLFGIGQCFELSTGARRVVTGFALGTELQLAAWAEEGIVSRVHFAHFADQIQVQKDRTLAVGTEEKKTIQRSGS
jgi:hypothetical protein